MLNGNAGRTGARAVGRPAVYGDRFNLHQVSASSTLLGVDARCRGADLDLEAGAHVDESAFQTLLVEVQALDIRGAADSWGLVDIDGVTMAIARATELRTVKLVEDGRTEFDVGDGDQVGAIAAIVVMRRSTDTLVHIHVPRDRIARERDVGRAAAGLLDQQRCELAVGDGGREGAAQVVDGVHFEVGREDISRGRKRRGNSMRPSAGRRCVINVQEARVVQPGHGQIDGGAWTYRAVARRTTQMFWPVPVPVRVTLSELPPCCELGRLM